MFGLQDAPRHGVNEKGLFSNAPLHFLAASGKATSLGLFSLISHGASIHEKNTSGQTFIHVLRFDKFLPGGDLQPYLGLLRCLTQGGFDVLQQDYYGRMIGWNFFENTVGFLSKDKTSRTTVEEIFSLLKVDLIFAKSNSDRLGDLFDSWMHCAPYLQPLSDERGMRSGFNELRRLLQPLDPYTWIVAKETRYSVLFSRYGQMMAMSGI